MTGILENFVARIETLEAFCQQIAAATNVPFGVSQQPQQQPQQQAFQQQPQQQAFQQQPQQQQPQQPQQQAFQQQPQQAVTADMITNLITPLVADPAVKAALTAEMQAMGLNGLQEAQPHQYAELYQRFLGVQARVQGQQQFAPGAPAPQQQAFQQQPQQGFQQPQQAFQQPPQHQPQII